MFSDIAGHWASQCILALARRGVVSGYPNRTFRPKATISRAEFAALLPKAFPELPDKQRQRSFRDVPFQHWASAVVSWSVQRDLITSYADGTFRPRQALSRARAIAAIMQGLEITQGVDAVIPDLLEPETAASKAKSQAKSKGKSEGNAIAQAFIDANSIAASEKGAIEAALKRGLLENLGEPRMLLPNAAITRGEVAALLCRALEIPDAELSVSYLALSASDRASEQSVFQQFLQQEAGFNESRLAFLDRGIQNSPYRTCVAHYAKRLQQPAGVVVPPSRQSLSAANVASYLTPYPKQGEVFFVDEGGLEFLAEDILAGCVCISSTVNGELQGRWLGRDALSDRQLWSATKFIPLLNLASRANATHAAIDLDHCKIRAVGSKRSSYSFQDLAAGIMTYDNRIASSNALAAMFKNFETPAQLEKWTQQMTGSQSLSFQGRYGEEPFIQHPELWSSYSRQVLLKSAETAHQGENLMSVYDLTRLLTMAAWHWQLPAKARIPSIQTRSLETIIRAMGVDTGRYIDVAIETLGLTQAVQEPVIISKSGFGRSDARDRTELTYCALAQFSLPRPISSKTAPDPSATHQRYSICFTLLAAHSIGDADEEARYVDALMASAVTAILRRLVLRQL
jgi:hypothetical protein